MYDVPGNGVACVVIIYAHYTILAPILGTKVFLDSSVLHSPTNFLHLRKDADIPA
jgi:hypothetical protein